MNVIDGRAIAAHIKTEVAAQVRVLPVPPKLTIIACAPNFETEAYLQLKTKVAADLGITLETRLLPADTTTDTIVAIVEQEALGAHGIIVQLPLPAAIDTDVVLAAIPKEKDVDAFGYTGGVGEVLPPVIGAIDEIARRNQIDFVGKRVVIFGSGRLVGAPALTYIKALTTNIVVITPTTPEAEVTRATKEAEVIILGVGQPGLLTPEQIHSGVCIFDAGASEDGGMIVGDALPSCAEKAGLFTPVPGGIGPITIALLFRNLVVLSSRQ